MPTATVIYEMRLTAGEFLREASDVARSILPFISTELTNGHTRCSQNVAGVSTLFSPLAPTCVLGNLWGRCGGSTESLSRGAPTLSWRRAMGGYDPSKP